MTCCTVRYAEQFGNEGSGRIGRGFILSARPFIRLESFCATEARSALRCQQHLVLGVKNGVSFNDDLSGLFDTR